MIKIVIKFMIFSALAVVFLFSYGKNQDNRTQDRESYVDTPSQGDQRHHRTDAKPGRNQANLYQQCGLHDYSARIPDNLLRIGRVIALRFARGSASRQCGDGSYAIQGSSESGANHPRTIREAVWRNFMATKKVKKSSKSKIKKHIDTIDFWGNPVHCTWDQWHGHIIEPLDGHPEMTGREAEVMKAIQDPDAVGYSTLTTIAMGYDKVTSADTIRVIVYYADETIVKAGATTGTIATAYPDDPAYTSQIASPFYVKPRKGDGA